MRSVLYAIKTNVEIVSLESKGEDKMIKIIECRLCGMRFFNNHALAIHLKFSCHIMKYRMNEIKEKMT